MHEGYPSLCPYPLINTIDPDESSINGLLWNMSLQKSIFYFLSCSVLHSLFHPPLASLLPLGFIRFHGQSSVSGFPLFSDWLFQTIDFCSYSRYFPYFTLLRFLNPAIQPEPYRLLLFSSVSVHLSST